ncbi:MAG: hypothetical protein V4537_03270 [Pseudomonadota bacterium]
MKKSYLAAALAVSVSSSSVAEAKKKPEPSALELQALQSRDIEGTKEQAFGAVMSVLQDSGYRIQAADKDTGLITGIASTSSKMVYSFWSGFGKSKKSPIVSAFIEQRTPTMTRVRLSFVMAKVKSSIYGAGAQDEEPIYDPTVYQKAFEQINQTMFIRAGMNAPAATAASATAPVAPPPSTPVNK